MALSVVSLFSGSSGNCTYVTAGGGEGILIDAGGSCAAVVRGLDAVGADPAGIRGVFVTHEHCDHVQALNVFAKKYRVPVHMTGPTAQRANLSPAAMEFAVLHPVSFRAEAAGLTVESFRVPHDSACCVGYRVTETATGESAAIATDIGGLDREIVSRFVGCRGVMLECNHDPAMLERNPAYPQALKDRIRSGEGHLPNDLCARCVRWLAEQGTGHFLLAHLSRENNTPELALKTVLDAVNGAGGNGPVGHPVTVAAALPSVPVWLMRGEEEPKEGTEC